ncbi:Cytochrome P450 monooxygenase aclL [Lachnellula arida]|uniref:Cytochrome P450 monooxygenase aclL n=1 Tax=Lachnellula arida TaxID=1316785 RepID=A0A8T9BJX3_9HELO|nr:Cytochrome P450 monooxygenase aclL [Lachnellula arida]
MDTELLHKLSLPALGETVLLLLAATILFFFTQAIYNAFIHPLHSIPGPKLNAISRLPYIFHHLDGTAPFYLRKLHEQYGDVVRYSISEVSFISGDTSWTEIYGHRTGRLRGHPTLEKDPAWYAPPIEGVQSLLFEPDEPHHRRRRAWVHSFSDKCLAQQFSTVQSVSDQLIEQLKEDGKGVADLSSYLSWTMFDIVSTLIYGQPLGCLSNRATHKNAVMIQNGMKAFRFLYVLWCWPIIKHLTGYLIDKKQIQEWIDHDKWLNAQTWARVARGPSDGKKDFLSFVIRQDKSDKENSVASGKKDTWVTDEELHVDSGLFLTAGTDTTAHALSTSIFLLCQHPEYMEKLKEEVRGRFTQYEDITPTQTNDMPYVSAVIFESLRLYAPTAVGFGRRVGKGGELISNCFIAEGTGVQVSQYPNNRSARNFAEPDSFRPERWLGDERFASDKKDAFQPFSTGARNCLGKTLAQSEMRLIMSKLFWTFDFELDESIGTDWLEKSLWKMTWVKDPLRVYCKIVER